MVGTAEKYVGVSRATSSKNRDGENFPVMLSCPPASIGARKLTQMAFTWNSGSTRRAWSAAVRPKCVTMVDAM